MGCLKLDYYEDLQVRTCVPMLSGEADVVQLWLSSDPLAEEFPNASPYNYCMNNPLRLVDPDGRGPYDVIITGTKKLEALSEMQKFVGSDVTLSMDNNGKVSYSQNLIGPLPIDGLYDASPILNAIDDHSVTVNVLASDTTTTSDGFEYSAGAFMGNTVDPLTHTVVAKQEINPTMLSAMSEYYGKSGNDTAHEVSEAYQGAKLAQASGISTQPATRRDANNQKSVYYQSHNNLAVPQTGELFKTELNRRGNEVPGKTKGGTTQWSVKKPSEYEPTIIKTRNN